jgi:hypothetical protein
LAAGGSQREEQALGEVDFEGDIVAAVGDLVPAHVEGWSAIGQMRADDAWLAYGNWLSRHVEPRPRTVHVSRELEQLLAGHPDEESVRTVLREVERGDDLTPRLSTRALYLHDDEAAERGRASRRDLDPLLNDWGVHHLHLGPHSHEKRFVQRSKNLLLISFLDDHAYAVTLLAHGSWADENILCIMADNWPEDGVLLGSLSGIRLAQPIPPESRLELRNAGVSTMYEHHDGRVYVPRGMMSTAGTSMTLGLQMDPGMTLIRRVEHALKSTPNGRLNALLRIRTGAKVSCSDPDPQVVRRGAPDLVVVGCAEQVSGGG